MKRIKTAKYRKSLLMNEYSFNPIYEEYNGIRYFHPGYYLNKTILENGLTIEQAAKKLPYKTPIEARTKLLIEIISGERNVTHTIAEEIAKIFGGSKLLWENMQSYYSIAKKKNTLKSIFNDNPDKWYTLKEIWSIECFRNCPPSTIFDLLKDLVKEGFLKDEPSFDTFSIDDIIGEKKILEYKVCKKP